MRDWNVIASVRDGSFARVCDFLSEFGEVGRTGFLNIVTMRVNDPDCLLEVVADRVGEHPEILSELGRLMPVRATFTFQTLEAFEARAREAAGTFLPDLANKSFHVRMHRHGFKGRISSHEEERLLGEALLEALEKAGTPGRVSFEDPDAVLIVETLGNRAGLSVWTREQRLRFPFLRIDH